jgi:hypothetical protein
MPAEQADHGTVAHLRGRAGFGKSIMAARRGLAEAARAVEGTIARAERERTHQAGLCTPRVPRYPSAVLSESH